MTEKDQDYAAEYRPRLARFPNELKSIARFGQDIHGASQETGIPDALQDNYYIRPIVEYINDPDTKFSTAAGKYRRAFQFIIEVALENPDMDWRNFGGAFLKRLKIVGQSEHQIKTYHDSARLLFVRAAEKCPDHRVKRDLHEIAGLSSGHRDEVGNWPCLRNPPNEPNRALEDVFGDDLSYTNDQYVASVTEYSAAYIIAWSTIRKRLRSGHPELMGRIIDAVAKLGHPRLREVETQQAYSYKTKLIKDDWLFLLRLNYEILDCLNEPLLNWIAITQHSGNPPIFNGVQP